MMYMFNIGIGIEIMFFYFLVRKCRRLKNLIILYLVYKYDNRIYMYIFKLIVW